MLQFLQFLKMPCFFGLELECYFLETLMLIDNPNFYAFFQLFIHLIIYSLLHPYIKKHFFNFVPIDKLIIYYKTFFSKQGICINELLKSKL
jgi:hypothetical protein